MLPLSWKEILIWPKPSARIARTASVPDMGISQASIIWPGNIPGYLHGPALAGPKCGLIYNGTTQGEKKDVDTHAQNQGLLPKRPGDSPFPSEPSPLVYVLEELHWEFKRIERMLDEQATPTKEDLNALGEKAEIWSVF